MNLKAMVGISGLLCSISCFTDLRLQSAAQLCATLNNTQLRAGDWIANEQGEAMQQRRTPDQCCQE